MVTAGAGSLPDADHDPGSGLECYRFKTFFRSGDNVPIKIFILSVLLMADVSSVGLLQRGRDHYRAGQYAEAVTALQTAADDFFSNEQMKRYVETGELETLPQFETAMVYLALAQAKLGREDDARATILRLVTAERIDEVYALLPLEDDAVDFEPLAARLAPTVKLPPNTQLARLQTTAIPPVQPRMTPAPSAPEPVPAAPMMAQTSDERAAAERSMEERIAAERASAQREADERVAAAQKAANERIATETAAVRRAADEQIAAERAAAQQAIDERVAAECAAAERAALDRIAAERAAAERAAQERIAAAEAEARRTHLATLRQADTLAESGRTQEAIDLYTRVANAEGVPRDVIAAAAAGLYRTGAFDEAVRAFRRLGTFRRGEEDLRYYYAVSLYETGNYGDAKRELACAVPFIQVTADVSRYRLKIEQTSARPVSF